MQKTFSFPLKGGLDLNTPAASIPPGFVVSSKNYEPNDKGGYRRIAGYERFDGRPSPSAANYWIVNFDQGSGAAIVPTDIVIGSISGTQSEVLSVTLTSGAWGVDAVGFLVVFNATGLYQNNEDLDVTTTRAIADGASIERGSILPDDDETNLRAAREATRDDILAVPGADDIRGVWIYNGVTYAFRDNVGQTQVDVFRSSATGWVAVNLGDYIDYSVGAVTAFVEGEVVTGAPSAATGVIVAVGVTGGSFTGGNAAGRLYIKSITGTFTGADTLSAPSTATANCDSAQTAVTLPAGGKYEFQNYNFRGQLGTLSMWGVSGAGRGLRYDGTDFALVHVTGMADSTDKPEHIIAHKKHLFFSFGSSIQHSSIGEPMIWSAITGAAEIATGDVVTGMKDQPGAVLGIFNRNRIYLLYGDDINNWDLVDYSLERGAIEYSLQDLGWSVYMDDRGMHTLRQTDAYGDLSMASISEIIDPLIQKQKTLIVDSVRIKSKNQYRIFYSDNSGIICRFDVGNKREFMQFEWDHKVTAICAEEDLAGFEQVFFGSTTGFVYQAEKGESFDGELISYFLRTAFCHCKTPRQKKRFHKATLQLDATDTPDLMFVSEFSYGATDQPPPVSVSFPAGTLNVGGGIWDADFWGDFIWDGQLVGEAQAYIVGQGINVSLLVQGSSNFESQHTLQSLTYNYSLRGLQR